MSIEGRATAEGTAGYRDRFAGKIPGVNFRGIGDLVVGSVAMGTYLGTHDDETDAAYGKALAEALKLGCNHVDTAINYRCMRSEKTIGRTLEKLFESGKFSREEIVVSTKGGYIPFDGEAPPNIRRHIHESYIEPGVVEEDDLIGGIHAMTPRFLSEQVKKSLDNLRIETIDVYYLHNPEVHRAVMPKHVFLDRMKRAFRCLEEEVESGRIARYGVASWEAFRAEPSSPVHISLAETVRIAEEIGGKGHHFEVVQIPFNAAMMEAFALLTQEVEGENLSAVDAAARLGIAVTASSPFLQGRLLKQFPEFLVRGIGKIDSNAGRAIQFSRSIPGIVSVVVGMSSALHVAENMMVTRHAPLEVDELFGLFSGE